MLVCAAVIAPMIVWNIGTSARGCDLRQSQDLSALRLHDSMQAVLHSSLNPADLASFGAPYVVAAGTTIAIARACLRGRGAGGLEAPRVVITVFTLYIFGRLTFLFLFSRFDVQGSYAIPAHTYLALMIQRLAPERAVGPARPAATR